MSEIPKCETRRLLLILSKGSVTAEEEAESRPLKNMKKIIKF